MSLCLPIRSGGNPSYVDGLARTPATCIPALWVKAFSPIIGVFGEGTIPLNRSVISDNSGSLSSVTVSIPYTTFSATATSLRGAIPLLSPNPFIVT